MKHLNETVNGFISTSLLFIIVLQKYFRQQRTSIKTLFHAPRYRNSSAKNSVFTMRMKNKIIVVCKNEILNQYSGAPSANNTQILRYNFREDSICIIQQLKLCGIDIRRLRYYVPDVFTQLRSDNIIDLSLQDIFEKLGAFL